MTDTNREAQHTALVYRPNDYDDWGVIRSVPDCDGYEPIVCQVRYPYVSNDKLNEHRENGTDPYGPFAAFIVRACNSHYQLVESLREAIEELWDRDHSSMDRIQFERANASLFAALSQAGGE